MNLDPKKERADVLAAIGLVLMMGLPILIGYGVVPYTNFGVEVVAVLGMGVLLISGALLAKDALPSSLPLRLALSFVVMLMLWTLAKMGLSPLSAVNVGTLLIYMGYLGGLLGAVWIGHVLMTTLYWPWLEKVLTRTLILAAVVAAVGSLMQYFAIDGSWMGLSPSAEPGRTYGFVRQPNHQSTYLNMAMAAALYLRTQKNLKNLAWYPISLLLIAALITTASRTGLIQLLLICGFYAWAGWAEGKELILRTVVEVLCVFALAWAVFYGCAVFFDIPFYGLSKLDRTTTEGIGVRRELWRGAWEMIVQRPMMGHLINSFIPTFMIQGHALETRMVFENAHNMFLQIGFEFGLPFAIVSYALLGWMCLSLGLSARTSDVARLMGGVLLCITVYAQFEYPLWYSHFLFPFGLCAGIYLSGQSLSSGREKPVQAQHGLIFFGCAARVAAAALGGLLLAGAVAANRDFYRLTPVFAYFDDSSLSEKVEKVGSVFWFSEVLDLAKFQTKSTSGDSLSKDQRLQLLQKVGCQRDEPWYQFSTIKILAEEGYLDDVRWLIFILHELNPRAVAALIDYLDSGSGGGVQNVVDFAKSPHKVAPSYQYFKKTCYR